MIKIQHKCLYKSPNDQNCIQDGENYLQVTVFHLLTEKKSKQKWLLCDDHLQEFLEANGENWIRWKKSGNEIKYSIVKDYKIIELP